MDRRFQAYNERVAAIDLKSDIDHHNFVHPERCQIAVPICDLLDQPNGDRQRQLLYGASVDVFEDVAGWAFVRQHSDGYVGYVQSAALGSYSAPTHYVTNVLTHCYRDADFKSPDLALLPMQSQIRVHDQKERFGRTDLGWIPLTHLKSLSEKAPDIVTEAQKFLGRHICGVVIRHWGLIVLVWFRLPALPAGSKHPPTAIYNAQLWVNMSQGT